MESKSESSRRLPPLLPIRAARLAARVPLTTLAERAGVPATYLSLAERGLRKLTPDQEERRRRALAELGG